MELILSEDVEIEMAECEFQLPSYMTKLSKEQIAEACASSEAESLVIAAGADPKDDKILLLTATRKMLVFDSRKYYIPPGPAAPHCGGKKIFLINKNGRWPGNSLGFSVDSSWMLSESEPVLKGIHISMNT